LIAIVRKIYILRAVTCRLVANILKRLLRYEKCFWASGSVNSARGIP
jgi:hypothetical protein